MKHRCKFNRRKLTERSSEIRWLSGARLTGGLEVRNWEFEKSGLDGVSPHHPRFGLATDPAMAGQMKHRLGRVFLAKRKAGKRKREFYRRKQR
jgi:hypothetical protein